MSFLQGKRFRIRAWENSINPGLWRHLAATAQTADPFHGVGPSVRATDARWRQSNGPGLFSHAFLPWYCYHKLTSYGAG